jgi:hypothetical protein
MKAVMALPGIPPRPHRLYAAIALSLGGLLCVPAAQAAAIVPLSSLDGSNGFRIDGAAASEISGLAASAAGDINGDGIDDLIVGAIGASPNGELFAGSGYVIFGRNAEGGASAISLSTLDGSNGFRLDGISAGDYNGWSVAAAGDINGDGIDDLIIGAPFADVNGVPDAGSSYVVFGRSASGFASAIDLSALDGSNGFRLDGVNGFDLSGRSVAGAGDINGDSIGDLIIAAPFADPNGVRYAGSSYVVFGQGTGSFATAVNLASLDGGNGFRLDGIMANDQSGQSVSTAGDINGDGIDDLIIGAYFADPEGVLDAGSSYVVFGRSAGSFVSTIDLLTLDGSNGFRLDGVSARDFSGTSLAAAGDINGDGTADLVIGARGADPNGDGSGSAYVVFGQSAGGFASVISLATLNGSDGFRLDGIAAGDQTGKGVSAAGDVNGDGIDDLIIGADRADPNGLTGAGRSYVVYGRHGDFASILELSTLDGSNGFWIDGAAAAENSGRSVAGAGDVNGDGVDDLVVGAPFASPDGMNRAGSSYVVFGVVPQDEPLLQEAALPAPVPPNASCPAGFFNARVDDGPGVGLQPGIFGLELLLDSPGARRLAGGLNFGGLVDVSQRGFAAVNIANSAGENQLLGVSLTGSARPGLGSSLPVRLNISRRVGADSTTVFEQVIDLTMSAPFQTTVEVPPGFYVAGVAVEGFAASEARGAPEGRFFFSLTTSFVDRPGGGFQGGAVVGGYHAENPFGGSSGFAAFCLATPHSISARVFGAPTYGASGARDLRLRLLDSNQEVIYSVP